MIYLSIISKIVILRIKSEDYLTLYFMNLLRVR